MAQGQRTALVKNSLPVQGRKHRATQPLRELFHLLGGAGPDSTSSGKNHWALALTNSFNGAANQIVFWGTAAQFGGRSAGSGFRRQRHQVLRKHERSRTRSRRKHRLASGGQH